MDTQVVVGYNTVVNYDKLINFTYYDLEHKPSWFFFFVFIFVPILQTRSSVMSPLNATKSYRVSWLAKKWYLNCLRGIWSTYTSFTGQCWDQDNSLKLSLIVLLWFWKCLSFDIQNCGGNEKEQHQKALPLKLISCPQLLQYFRSLKKHCNNAF